MIMLSVVVLLLGGWEGTLRSFFCGGVWFGLVLEVLVCLGGEEAWTCYPAAPRFGGDSVWPCSTTLLPAVVEVEPLLLWYVAVGQGYQTVVVVVGFVARCLGAGDFR